MKEESQRNQNIAWYTHSIFARECVFTAHNLFIEVVVATLFIIFAEKCITLKIEISLIAFM